jgi:hypothetical protein
MTHRYRSFSQLSGLVAALVCLPALHGQTVSYETVGADYLQNFDGLPVSGSTTLTGRGPHALEGVLGATGLVGWYGANPGGSSSNTEFKAHDGSLSGSAGRGLVSFGSANSTDRALGALSTSNQVNTFGLYLTNLTGQTLTQVSLSFFGEQWRAGEPADPANSLDFSYRVFASDPDLLGLDFVRVSELDFEAISFGNDPQFAVDGNSPEFRRSIAHTFNVTWAPGEVLVLRWDAQDYPGQDSGLAIDDLRFAAIPEPSTYAAAFGAAVLLLVAVRRFRRRA